MKLLAALSASALILALSVPAHAQGGYRSSTDSFGNTTTYGPNGFEAQTVVDSFGNETTYIQRGDGRQEVCKTTVDSFGDRDTRCR